MLQSVLCITTNIYLVHVLVVLLHARFSIVSPIPFLLAAIFWGGHPYIGSTTVLPDYLNKSDTEMELSMRRSEPSRPLVVPSLRFGHYSPGPLRFTTTRRYLHFSV